MDSEDVLIYFVLGSIILVVIIFQVANAIKRSSYKSRHCSSLEDQWSELQAKRMNPGSNRLREGTILLPNVLDAMLTATTRTLNHT